MSGCLFAKCFTNNNLHIPKKILLNKEKLKKCVDKDTSHWYTVLGNKAEVSASHLAAQSTTGLINITLGISLYVDFLRIVLLSAFFILFGGAELLLS